MEHDTFSKDAMEELLKNGALAPGIRLQASAAEPSTTAAEGPSSGTGPSGDGLSATGPAGAEATGETKSIGEGAATGAAFTPPPMVLATLMASRAAADVLQPYGLAHLVIVYGSDGSYRFNVDQNVNATFLIGVLYRTLLSVQQLASNQRTPG